MNSGDQGLLDEFDHQREYDEDEQLKHKIDNYQERKATSERREKVAPILELAIKACKKFGGMAEIADGYFIIDSSVFDITLKKEKQDANKKGS